MVWWLCVRCALNNDGWRWLAMSGSDVLVRVAGRAVMREVCVARVTRIRRCSHVVHILQTDIVVAIDVFDYVTRAHIHTLRKTKRNEIQHESKYFMDISESPLNSQVLPHCWRSTFWLRWLLPLNASKNVANNTSQQQRRRLTESWMTRLLKWTLSPLSSKISTFITLCFVG